MRKSESGQALVLVLLSLSVVLTLILFILSRSVTDIATSARQEESVRAFSAAEAGIERALVTSGSYSDIGIGNASYTTTTTDFALGSDKFNFPSPVSYGDTATVWFVSHDANGNLKCDDPLYPCYHSLVFPSNPSIKVCWGNPGTSAGDANTPAIEFSVYYKTPAENTADVRIGRAALDPNSSRRSNDNKFSAPDPGTCVIDGKTYEFTKTIVFSNIGVPADSYQSPDGLQLAKIRMLYNDIPQELGVTITEGTLPSQGQAIDSTGNAGDSNRRIMVYQSWGESPFASNSVISPVGITK